MSIGLKGSELVIPPLYRAQIFPQTVFLVVAMQWVLGDEDVWWPELEYRLKRATTFAPTVGSHSKFSRVYFHSGSYGMAT